MRGKKMKKFFVQAHETIVYEKYIECESEEILKNKLENNEIYFETQDIGDSHGFNIDYIEEQMEGIEP